jgi:ABC-type glycerol-3-phosphate transport system substrate-binding protein
MKNSNLFQILVLVGFGLFALAGAIIFAMYRTEDPAEVLGSVVIWGTVDQTMMSNFLYEVETKGAGDLPQITYVQKKKENLNSEFVNALATGSGPDMILLSHDEILRNKDKLLLIPYESFSERQFKDRFIEEGELYMTPTGILGFPFIIDPLVMYWNRSIFSSAGISTAPKYWDEFFGLSQQITARDQAYNITRSFVAFGETRNVENASEVLSAIFMQAGDPITQKDGSAIQVVLGDTPGYATPPAVAGLRFYIEFSNATKNVYTWNRALPQDRQRFLSGDLAIYFGFASELTSLRQTNPNLNFDVATVPQTREGKTNITFGRMQALAISRTGNVNGSLAAIGAFTGADAIEILTDLTSLPPVRRDLLAQRPSDAYLSVFYQSAIIARSWHIPDQQKTDSLFQEMVEATISGRVRDQEAIQAMNRELKSILK